MQLTQIKTITGTIELKTGLHIGAGDSEMRIGGTDNPVVKDPLTGQPYIPGSSLKGKMRSLLEWKHGLVLSGKPYSFHDLKNNDNAKGRELLKLFGGAPEKDNETLSASIGPSRLAFWDCAINNDWLRDVQERNLLSTEDKSENSINRIAGVADSPRFTERVIAGARFDFRLSLKIIDDESLMPMVLEGLKLLEWDSLGGSGSRGYGKIRFVNLQCDGHELDTAFSNVQPFPQAA